jgi:hypothetical protein
MGAYFLCRYDINDTLIPSFWAIAFTSDGFILRNLARSDMVNESKSIIPIIINEADIRNPERLIVQLQTVLYKHNKNSQFLITIPERNPCPVLTGSQDFNDDI